MSESYPLIESIRCHDGVFPLLYWHQQRLNYTFNALWPDAVVPSLHHHLHQFPIPDKGLFKCRVLYGKTLGPPTYEPYVLRPPSKLQIVEKPNINYSLKWAARDQLSELLQQAGTCEDVLIVRNGQITDTTYCNIAFLRMGTWYTPASPLLAGVRRASLIDQGLIRVECINLSQLATYSHFKVFNAMISWDDCPPRPLESIIGL